ncbi:hypothetical protein AAE478_009081 [Parahypoxylon ruwenzoriense]
MFHIKQTKPIRRKPGETSRRPPNLRYVYLLTAFVSIGALLFGYDQGVMGVIVADARWISLTKPANSWVTSPTTVAVNSVPCCNRRLIILPPTIGRVILGYGVGICAGGVPLYVSEIAPAKLRGRIIGIEQMILCFGELVAFCLNYGFNFLRDPDWWRIPLAIQVLPAVLLGPSKIDTNVPVKFSRLHGDDGAGRQVAGIAEKVAFEKAVATTTWGDMFKTRHLN